MGIGSGFVESPIIEVYRMAPMGSWDVRVKCQDCGNVYRYTENAANDLDALMARFELGTVNDGADRVARIRTCNECYLQLVRSLDEIVIRSISDIIAKSKVQITDISYRPALGKDTGMKEALIYGLWVFHGDGTRPPRFVKCDHCGRRAASGARLLFPVADKSWEGRILYLCPDCSREALVYAAGFNQALLKRARPGSISVKCMNCGYTVLSSDEVPDDGDYSIR